MKKPSLSGWAFSLSLLLVLADESGDPPDDVFLLTAREA